VFERLAHPGSIAIVRTDLEGRRVCPRCGQLLERKGRGRYPTICRDCRATQNERMHA
jgi:tRNA(Ile2) C34 agmatinyltransferase TiaS